MIANMSKMRWNLSVVLICIPFMTVHLLFILVINPLSVEYQRDIFLTFCG
jgi:hypothetical protein